MPRGPAGPPGSGSRRPHPGGASVPAGPGQSVRAGPGRWLARAGAGGPTGSVSGAC